jgi:NDP-sugar pyrophosphorylase family protein
MKNFFKRCFYLSPKKRFSFTLDQDLISEVDRYIDGENIRSRSEAVEKFLRNFLADKKSAVILAGGLSENLFISETKLYRPLITLPSNKTLIEDSITKVRSAGWENIFIIGMNPLLAELYAVLRNGENIGVKISYIEERDALGTAKTLQQVQNLIRSDFLVIPADTYFDFNLSSLLEYHLRHRATATFAIYSRTIFDSKYKGVVEMEGPLIISHEERPIKPSSHLIKTLIGVFSPEIFEFIPNGAMFYTIETDIIPNLINERKCFGYLVSGDWFNIHDNNDLIQLFQFLNKK